MSLGGPVLSKKHVLLLCAKVQEGVDSIVEKRWPLKSHVGPAARSSDNIEKHLQGLGGCSDPSTNVYLAQHLQNQTNIGGFFTLKTD